MRSERCAEDCPAIFENECVDVFTAPNNQQHRADSQTQHDKPVDQHVGLLTTSSKELSVDIVRAGAGGDDELTVGGGANRRQDSRQDHAGQYARQHVLCGQHEAGLSCSGSSDLGRKIAGPRCAVLRHRAHDNSDRHRPPDDHRSPGDRNDSADDRILASPQCHKANEHVRLTGEAEVDSKRAAS